MQFTMPLIPADHQIQETQDYTPLLNNPTAVKRVPIWCVFHDGHTHKKP